VTSPVVGAIPAATPVIEADTVFAIAVALRISHGAGTRLEGAGCGTAELSSRRSVAFGPAREWLWIAAVYRAFGHLAAMGRVLCRSVACRTEHDDLAMSEGGHVGWMVLLLGRARNRRAQNPRSVRLPGHVCCDRYGCTSSSCDVRDRASAASLDEPVSSFWGERGVAMTHACERFRMEGGVTRWRPGALVVPAGRCGARRGGSPRGRVRAGRGGRAAGAAR
jgi:hypothetical protein